MNVLAEGGFGLLSTTVAYLAVLVTVRIVGRRTVTQMSAFDVVITIALGSLLAQTSTSGTALVRGLVGIAVLLLLQTLLAWARRRIAWVDRLISFEPRILVRDGEVHGEALVGGLTGPQMTESELSAELRGHGIRSLEDVDLAVLEPTGELSVLRRGGDDAQLWIVARRREG